MNPQHHQSINLRQLCIGYFLYSTCIKVLTLPSALASSAGNWAWLSAIIGVIFELLLVVLSSLILKFTDNQNKFFRTICWLSLPIVIFEIAVTAKQIYHLAYTDLFTDLGITILVITLVALGLFFLTRKPRAMFRAGEILRLFFALGLILAIIPTLYNLQIDWRDLVRGDNTHIISATALNLCFFESATFVLAFGSETRKTNRDLLKINLTALLCGIGFMAFMILFVFLFGSLSQYQIMGLVDMTTAAQFITNNGSLDWLIATSILSALVLRFGIQLVAVVTLIKRGLNRR